MSTTTASYTVRRWRGFVDPRDLPAAVYLLASGARFQDYIDAMPHSPSATEVYYDAAHCDDVWPFARPSSDRMEWLAVNNEHGGVLDVFEFTNNGSAKRGVFVTLSIGNNPSATPMRNTPALTVSDNGVSVSDDTIALFAPTTETTKYSRDMETAYDLLVPIFGTAEGIRPHVGIERAVAWDTIAHNSSVTTRELGDNPDRCALNGFSLDRTVYVDARDPLWTATPRARGTDLHFDEQTTHGIFTQFVLEVHN